MSEPTELNETRAAAVSFSPPMRRLLSIKPGTLLGASVVIFLVGLGISVLLDSALPTFATTCVAMLGAAASTFGACRQLRRFARKRRREEDHSLLVLLFLVIAGVSCCALGARWVHRIAGPPSVPLVFQSYLTWGYKKAISSSHGPPATL